MGAPRCVIDSKADNCGSLDSVERACEEELRIAACRALATILQSHVSC